MSHRRPKRRGRGACDERVRRAALCAAPSTRPAALAGTPSSLRPTQAAARRVPGEYVATMSTRAGAGSERTSAKALRLVPSTKSRSSMARITRPAPARPSAICRLQRKASATAVRRSWGDKLGGFAPKSALSPLRASRFADSQVALSISPEGSASDWIAARTAASPTFPHAGSGPTLKTRSPRADHLSRASCSRRVFPIPGSPTRCAAEGMEAASRWRASSHCTASSLATNDVNHEPRLDTPSTRGLGNSESGMPATCPGLRGPDTGGGGGDLEITEPHSPQNR
jgi:hypothetical protein